jgi:signal peptidase II
LTDTRNSWLNRRVWLTLGLAVGIIAIDQITKAAALQNLQTFRRVPVLGDTLGWYLTFNDSAAFSLGFGATWFFTALSAVAVLAIIWFAPRMHSLSWAISAGILLGGVAGNLIDRLTKSPGFPNGQVVDFIQIPFNFPIFNFADICISGVMTLVVIRVFRGDKIGGAPKSR